MSVELIGNLFTQLMSTQANITQEVRCTCNLCSGGIAFDSDHAGETITCPHCGMDTVLVLFVPPQPPAIQTPVVEPPKVQPNPKLTECSDCQATVSRNADSCPHCGSRIRKRRGVFYYTLAVIASLIVLTIGVWFVGINVASFARAWDATANGNKATAAEIQHGIRLSDIQRKEVESGYVLTAENVSAIKAGRTAGLAPLFPKKTPNEIAAAKAIKIISHQVSGVKLTSTLAMAKLRITLENPTDATGSGYLCFYGMDAQNQKVSEDGAGYYLSVSSRQKRTFDLNVVLDRAEWDAAKRYGVEWEPSVE